MGRVGEEGESERHEAPADTLAGIVLEGIADDFSQSRKDDRTDHVCGIGLTGNQEQHEDESVQDRSRTETADHARGIQVHECSQERKQCADIGIKSRMDGAADASQKEAGEIGYRHQNDFENFLHINRFF